MRICQEFKRSVLLQFLYEIVAPVAQYGNNGFLAQIGRGVHAVTKFFKVHVLNFVGDGELLDFLAGTQHSRINRNCRCCMDVATSRLLIRGEDAIEYRRDNFHELVVKRMGQLMDKVVLERHRIVDATEKMIRDKANSLCVNAGTNPLYRLFYYFNSKNITSFHQSLYPDRLHVILKGIVEKTISWTLSILHDVMHLVPGYKDSMRKLDSRISEFPVHQSFEFFRLLR